MFMVASLKFPLNFSELNKYVTSLQQFTMVTSGTDLGTLCFMTSPGEIWEIIIYYLLSEC